MKRPRFKGFLRKEPTTSEFPGSKLSASSPLLASPPRPTSFDNAWPKPPRRKLQTEANLSSARCFVRSPPKMDHREMTLHVHARLSVCVSVRARACWPAYRDFTVVFAHAHVCMHACVRFGNAGMRRSCIHRRCQCAP